MFTRRLNILHTKKRGVPVVTKNTMTRIYIEFVSGSTTKNVMTLVKGNTVLHPILGLHLLIGVCTPSDKATIEKSGGFIDNLVRQGVTLYSQA